jgi:translation initiation factor 2D
LPAARFLLLDPTLCDALFKGVIKKGQPFPTALDKAELRDKFLARMQAQTRVSRGGYQVRAFEGGAGRRAGR